jgi:thiamine-monophosphate kinase
VIRSIVGEARRLPVGYSKIGDDVALLPSGKGMVVLKVDMLVQRTDMPKGMSFRQAARKAVAMCVSDFAAKGVKPDAFLLSLGLRRGTSEEEIRELANGFRKAQDEWGIRLVGGDTNEAGELVIDCAMIGFARDVVGRSGAKAGDLVMVTGPFGYPPAGLKILQEGAKASPAFRKKAVESTLNPKPPLALGLALAPYLSAAMDSSDGLARSLHTLAKKSGVGFQLSSLPMANGVEGFARANGVDSESLVLAGGEEYEIVGTVRPSSLRGAEVAARMAGRKLMVIGRATDKKGKVTLSGQEGEKPVPDEGWLHLG